MAYVSTPGLHEEFAQPNAAAPAALHFQEELARLNAAEPAALQGGSQEPTVEVTMSPPPDFQAQLHEAYLKGLAAGNPSAMRCWTRMRRLMQVRSSPLHATANLFPATVVESTTSSVSVWQCHRRRSARVCPIPGRVSSRTPRR